MSIDQNFDNQSTFKNNTGTWNQEETLKYVIFLEQNKTIMSSKFKKRKFRVFDQMAELIKTRTPLQCRSHHQKAMEKYKQVNKIIQFEREQIKGNDYQTKFSDIRERVKINETIQRSQLIDNISQKRSQDLKQGKYEIQGHLFCQVQTPTNVQNFMNPSQDYVGFYESSLYTFLPIQQQYWVPNFFFFPQFINY